MASPDSTIAQMPGAPEVAEWLRWAGFRFDPFTLLDAAADPHLSKYLVGHHIFARAWGDDLSWVFAPAGGGKTALRISVMQACWVGQETNRPFPIPYVPPFLSWGHAHPSEEEHLAALARAGAIALFLTLAHRVHWFFRLDRAERRRVAEALLWNFPGPLSSYLERCRAIPNPQTLSEVLDPAFIIPNPPAPADLMRWCDALEAAAEDDVSPPPEERWTQLKKLLQNMGFPSIYILLDGLDGAPETVADPSSIVLFLEPLLRRAKMWAEERVFLKGFLPLEVRPLLEDRFQDIDNIFDPTRVSAIHWTPDLLAEVVRRRVYVATEGAFGSLDALASPALRDIETLLAKTVYPLPREMLVITRRVIEEHLRRGGNGLLTAADVQAAIQWYRMTSTYEEVSNGC